MKFPIKDYDLQNIQHLQEVYSEMRKVIPEQLVPRLILAGGSVRDALFGFKPNDYDFFFYVPETLQQDRVDRLILKESPLPTKEYVVPKVLANLKAVFRKDQCKRVAKDKDIEESLLRSDVILKYMDIKPSEGDWFDKPLQVMYYSTPSSLQEIIDSFDLDICQFGFDGKYLYTGTNVRPVAVRKAVLNKGPVTLLNPTSSERRLNKFKYRFKCDIKRAVKDSRNSKRTLEFLPDIDYRSTELTEALSAKDVTERIGLDGYTQSELTVTRIAKQGKSPMDYDKIFKLV